ELDPVPVLQVAHPAPRRVPLDVPLVPGRADLRRPLLELDRVAPGIGGDVDQGLGVVQVAVVVDADLTGDVDRVIDSDPAITDGPDRGTEGWHVGCHGSEARKPTWRDRAAELNVGRTPSD